MTKEELRQYQSIKAEICQLDDRIKELERLNHGYDQEVVQPLRDLYIGKLETLIQYQLKIEKAFESLDPTERKLMRLRYIEGADWLEICAEIQYESAQTYRIHARALSKIKDL